MPSGLYSSISNLSVRTVIIELWMCSISDHFLRLASRWHAFIIFLQFNYLNVWDQTHFFYYFMQCSIHLWKKKIYVNFVFSYWKLFFWIHKLLTSYFCFKTSFSFSYFLTKLAILFRTTIRNSSFWRFECIFICYSLWYFSTFVILMYFNFSDLISELVKN